MHRYRGYFRRLCGAMFAIMASTAWGEIVSVPIPPEQSTIRLQGTHAAAGFFIQAPAEAEKLTIVANLSLSEGLDAERSFVQFLGNGQAYGRVEPADIRNQSVRVKFSLDSEALRPGSNHIRIMSSLQSDRIRSIDETYALYAELEIVSISLDGGQATQEEMALALLASGPGAVPLYLTSAQQTDNNQTMQNRINATQAYARLQRGAPPRIHIESPNLILTTPGHRLVIGTQARLQRQNDTGLLADLPLTSGGPLIDDNGFVTWVITGSSEVALRDALDAFINRLPASTERLPRPKPGALFTLDPWLSDLADQRTRIQRREVSFLLPYNYQPERAPERARVEVPYNADTAVDTRVQVAINGRFMAEQTVRAGRSTEPKMLSIPLPWSSYAAGLNTLTLRITTTEPRPDTRGAPLDLVEPVRLYIPRSMSSRITPRLAAALSAPPIASVANLNLVVRPNQRSTREAALTLLANLASLTGQPISANFQTQAITAEPTRTLVVGTPDVLDIAPLVMPGLSRATLLNVLAPVGDIDRYTQDNPIARRLGRKSGWPSRIARPSRLARDEQDLLSTQRITDWAELTNGAALAIEDSIPEAMNGERRDVFYLLARDAQTLPAVAASLTQKDLSGFNRGASLLNATRGWQDFAYTVAGTNAGRSATGTELVLLNRIGRYPLEVIAPALIALIVALALIGNLALTRGRKNRA